MRSASIGAEGVRRVFPSELLQTIRTKRTPLLRMSHLETRLTLMASRISLAAPQRFGLWEGAGIRIESIAIVEDHGARCGSLGRTV